MIVLTAEQAATVDHRAINEVGIPGLVLMETAGRAVTRVLFDEFADRLRAGVTVFCGPGNNGGDGFVVARALALRGVDVEVCLLGAPERLKGDAAHMARLLRQTMPEVIVRSLHDPADLEPVAARMRTGLVVDALFGTGLARALEGTAAATVACIERGGLPVVSIDIPSGVNGTTGAVPGPAVRADLTVVIGFLKRGVVLYPGAEYGGRIRVAEIGFPPALATEEGDGVDLVEPAMVRSWLPHRGPTAHKGSAGKVVVVAGSAGMSGAAMLACRAALRMAAGLVVLAVPQSLGAGVQGSAWEALSAPLPDGGRGWLGPDSLDAALEAVGTADALAIGPGLGRREETLGFVRELLARADLPVIVDADALRALPASRPVSSRLVVTPHPGEMSTLLDWERPRINADRLAAARECASRFGVVALLKGAHTVVAHPDGRVRINPTGNSGMATGGMGDVLTGAIGALLAQGLEPFEAASAGAFVHGLGGDLVADGKGERGLLARDVAERLPKAVRLVLRESERSRFAEVVG